MHYINMWISIGHTAGRHFILQKTDIYTPQQYNYGRYVVDYSAANSMSLSYRHQQEMHYINMWISSGHTAGRHVILQKTDIYTPQQYNYGRYVVDYSAANSIYSIIF